MVSWLGCKPDNSGNHLRVTAAAVWAMQEAALKFPTSPIKAYSCNLHVLDTVQDSQQVTYMTMEDWYQAQQADPTLSLVISGLLDGTLEWWQSKSTDPPAFSLFLWEQNHLVLKQGILNRCARSRESETTLFQLALPATQREVALKGCHDQIGHLGLEHMLDLMCDQFFWPCMAAQAKEHIRRCHLCLAFKAKQPKAPLKNIMATHPLELGHLDYLCLEPGKGLEENVLVVIDHFTRYTQPYVTRSQSAQTTAKVLWDKFIVHYGLPRKILSDQGWNYEHQLVADLCMLIGMWKIQTSPYHPHTNGQCERFNSTLIKLLGTLPPEKKSEWKNHIGMLVHAYICTQNSATGFSPYYLMHRRWPHLPIDVTLGVTPQNTTAPNTFKFIQKIRENAKWACKKAKAFQAKEAQHHKNNYDKWSRAVALEVGDVVLICVTAFRGHHKIQDWWENREYVVEKQPYPDVPVYIICPRDGEGCSQILHRNYFLPINSNIGQDVKDEPMAGVENYNTSTPVPSMDSETADAGPSRMVTPSTVGSTPQGSLDQPAPLSHSTQTTQKWLQWRYWNFGLLADTSPSSIWDALVGLCIHVISCLYTIF